MIPRLCIRVATLAAIALATVATSAEERQDKPKKIVSRAFSADRSRPSAISGIASSALNCVGNAGANVHTIGFVPASTEVIITFESDFDPIATVTNVQMGDDAPDDLARAAFFADDDTGGNLEPEIRYRTTFAGTLNLHVSKFSPDDDAGCYFYKVEVRTP